MQLLEISATAHAAKADMGYVNIDVDATDTDTLTITTCFQNDCAKSTTMLLTK